MGLAEEQLAQGVGLIVELLLGLQKERQSSIQEELGPEQHQILWYAIH